MPSPEVPNKPMSERAKTLDSLVSAQSVISHLGLQERTLFVLPTASNMIEAWIPQQNVAQHGESYGLVKWDECVFFF